MRLKCVQWETEPRALEVITQETDTKEREREQRKERILEYQCCDRDSSELCGIVEVLKKAQDRTSEGRG